MHHLYNVIKINFKPLAKAFYALISVWLVGSVLMYLCERNDDNDDDGMFQKDRYRDIPTAMQYTLTHLTGDYPLVVYTLPAKIFLGFSILFGIALIGAPTGIFAAGFANYLHEHRKKTSLDISRAKSETIIWAVCKLQSHFRKKKRERGDLVTQPDQAFVRQPGKTVAENWRDFVKGRTCLGNFFNMFCNWILILDVIAILISSIPENRDSKSAQDKFDKFEVFCTGVFTLEYIAKLLASAAMPQYSNNPCRFIFSLARLRDLLCILPLYTKLIFWAATDLCDDWQCQTGSARDTVMPFFFDTVVIIRVTRMLSFKCIEKETSVIKKSIVKALPQLWAPSIIAAFVWVMTATIFMWLQGFYGGDNSIPGAEEEEWMVSIPTSMYWCVIFLLGEWANVDFTDGAGSRMAIFYCLFAIMLFAIPTGILVEAVQATLAEFEHEQRAMAQLYEKLSPDMPVAYSPSPLVKAPIQVQEVGGSVQGLGSLPQVQENQYGGPVQGSQSIAQEEVYSTQREGQSETFYTTAGDGGYGRAQ
jgi:hypothetical protein